MNGTTFKFSIERIQNSKNYISKARNWFDFIRDRVSFGWLTQPSKKALNWIRNLKEYSLGVLK